MPVRAVLCVCGLAACGSVSAKSDASVAGDGKSIDGSGSSSDAATICSPTGAFEAPVPVASLNTSGDEGAPRFTANELEAVFNRTPSGGTDSDLFIADRSSPSGLFSSAVAIAQSSSTSADYNPSITSDGLTLFFESYRSGVHIWVATRASTAGTFGAASLAAGINSTSDNDVQPFVTLDGQELWFASTRAGGLGGYDIYRAVKNGNAYGGVTPVTALSSAGDDWLPTLSADKLTIYLTSTRTGGAGGLDIWTSHRASTSDAFPAPTVVTELNSTGDDYPGWLSPDNCRLYFASKRGASFDIYVATRHP